MIVVIDTSVWISALHFGGKRTTPLRAVEQAVRSDLLATSVEINAEIERILTEKFRWNPDAAKRIIARFFKRAMVVSITGGLRICRDPNDDMLVECAVVAGAQVIISGDKDLLVLGEYEGIRIVSPAEYLALGAP